ncbi:T9SS type A sorting domain-containing protein [Bacteroidales bacterium OttesenSCG-928-I14]|nr:T9SS type A sorting domain-containing protein [Bacteroidales bacterium OttesenSCG-928-I14]
MKQEKRKRWKQICLLSMCFVFLGLSVPAKAQQVSWHDTQGIVLSSPALGVMGSNITMDTKFMIVNADLKDGQLQVVLPNGAKVVSVQKGSSDAASLVLGTHSVSEASTGDTIRIPMTKIVRNKYAHLRLTLNAPECDKNTSAVANPLVQVSVINAAGKNIPGNQIQPAINTKPLEVRKPVITGIPVQANSNELANPATDAFTYSIPLSVSNGVSVKSMKIILTKDSYTTLSNFKLGSKNITPIIENNKITLNLTEALVGTTPISASKPQTLTFKAQASIKGTRNIKAAVEFPYVDSGSPCSTNNNLFNLYLNYTPQLGDASLQTAGASHVYVHPQTGAPVTYAVDGQTVNWARWGVKNVGNAPILQAKMRVFENMSCASSIVSDTEDVYVQVGSGPIKKLDKSSYSYSGSMPAHQTATGLTRPEFVGKPRYIEGIKIDSIPAGVTAYIYFPIIRGIVDNTEWGTPPNGINSIYHTSGFNWTSYLYIENQGTIDYNGKSVSMTGANYGANQYIPTFTTLLSEIGLKHNKVTETIVPVAIRSVSGEYAAEFNIQLPKWAELYDDGSGLASSIILTNGQKLAYQGLAGDSITHNAATNTYTVFIYNRDNYVSDLKIRYTGKPNTFGYTENQSDTIRYWFDWHSGYELNDTKRPVLKSAKNIQKVNYIINEDGIVIDNAYLHRQSRGLAIMSASSSWEYRTPKDGSKASFDDIRNDYYLVGDTGHINIEARIVGAGYKYLYVPITSGYNTSYLKFAGLDQDDPISKARVIIDGTTELSNPTIIESGTQRFVKFTYTDAGGFPVSNDVKITIPFRAIKQIHTRQEMAYEAYMSNTDMTTVTQVFAESNADRHGADMLSELIAIYDRHGGYQQYNHTTNTLNKAGRVFLGNYRMTSNNTGYNFPNEYRPYMYPDTLVLTMPAGIVADSLMIDYNQGRNITSTAGATPGAATARWIKTPASSVKQANGTTIVKYAMCDLFDFTVTSEAEARAAAAAGKWIAPQNYPLLMPYLYVTPTAEAEARSTIASSFYYYGLALDKEDYTTRYVQSLNLPLVYTGLRGDMNILGGNSIVSYGSMGVLPTLSLAIAAEDTSIGAQDVWLYIKGDVKDVFVSPQANNSIVYKGEGLNNCWVKVPALALNSAQNFSVYYTANNPDVKTTVEVFMVSTFADPMTFTPDTSKAVDENDLVHNGPKRTFTTQYNSSSKIAVQGAVDMSTLPAAGISYRTNYTIGFSINSLASEADLYNGEIKLNIPAGQSLSGIQYRYPSGSGAWTTVSTSSPYYNSLKTAIDGSNPNTSVSINIDELSEQTIILPGTKTTNVMSGGDLLVASNALRTFEVRLTLNPDCDTELIGSRFGMQFDAKDALDVTSSSSHTLTNPVMTDITTDYGFETEISTVDGNHAFGGKDLSNILQVKVTKVYGDKDIEDTDYLELRLPRWVDLDGKIIINAPTIAAIHETEVTIASNTVSGDDRIVKIILPYAALNAFNVHGVDVPFIYNVPVVYTHEPDFNLDKDPVKTIVAGVYTMKRFNDECEPKPFEIGVNNMDVALISLLGETPYTSCVGNALDLVVLSEGFDGLWASNPSLTSVLETGKEFEYIPSRAEFPKGGVKNLFIKADFNGVEYGSISILVNVNPSPVFIGTFPMEEAICSGSAHDGKILQTEYLPNVAIEWVAEANPRNSLEGFELSGNGHLPRIKELINLTDEKATLTYTIVAKSQEGCVSDTVKYILTVNPLPSLKTTNIPPVHVGASVDLATGVKDIPAKGITYYDNNYVELQSSVVACPKVGAFVYYVRYTNETTGCSTDYLPIIVDVQEGLLQLFINGSDLCAGQDHLFEGTINNTSLATEKVEWISTNPLVATVNKDSGLVTGVNPGTFSIILRHTQGGYISEVESKTYNVYALPHVVVEDAIVCEGTTLNISSLVKDVLNGDHFAIYSDKLKTNLISGPQTINATTTYYVEALSNGGACANETLTPVKVTVIDALEFDLTNSSISICEGSSYDLASLIKNVTLPDYKVYYREAASNDAIVGGFVKPTSGETHYYLWITSIDGNCISEEKVVTVVWGTPAPAEISMKGGDFELCIGTEAELNTSVSGSTFKWSVDKPSVIKLSDSKAGSVKVEAMTAGEAVVSYSYENANGCGAYGSYTVYVTALPVVDLLLGNYITACEGEILMIRDIAAAPAGYMLRTYLNGNLLTSDRIVVGSTKDTYEFEVENPITGCISARTNVVINPIAMPTFSLLNDVINVCQGDDSYIDLSSLVDFTSFSDCTVEYNIRGSRTIFHNPIVSPEGTTYYELSVVSDNGCRSEKSVVVVKVNPKPLLSRVSLGAFCLGEEFDLANGVLNPDNFSLEYFDTNKALLASTKVTPEKAGVHTFYVRATNTNGCVGEYQEIVAEVRNIPTVVETYSMDVCEGETVLFSDLARGSAGTKLNFYLEGETIAQTADRVIVGDKKIVYEVEAEDLYAGCRSIRHTVIITAIPRPVVKITQPATICSGTEYDLYDALDDIWEADYLVEFFTNKGRLLPSSVVAPADTTVYMVRIQNKKTGCVSLGEKIQVNVFEAASAENTSLSILGGADVCPETDFVLEAKYTGATPWTIVYSDGKTNGVLTDVKPNVTISGITEDTRYFVVSVKTGNECLYTEDQIGDVSVTAVVKTAVKILEQPESQIACADDINTIVALTVVAEGDGLTYQWYKANGDKVEVPSATSATLELSLAEVDSPSYFVVVSGDCGQEISESAMIVQGLDLIHQVRNHTLVINNNVLTNGGHDFVYYYWYKDGELISEGTHDDNAGVYYLKGQVLDPNAIYHAVMIAKDGKRYRTCDFIVTIDNFTPTLAVYPNPVNKTNSYVSAIVESEDEAALSDGVIEIYNSNGNLVHTCEVTGFVTKVRMPELGGTYVLKFKSTVLTESVKLIVQ